MVGLRELSQRFPEEQKAYLQNMLLLYPSDRLLLEAYYESLDEISKIYFGILNAVIPGAKLPLFFRANSSDIWNLRQVFQLREYNFDFPYPPGRILDLGAYVGFAAVFFANRFPNAEIVCVEPDWANFQILKMNTIGYPKVRAIRGAIWHHSTRLNLQSKMGGEAWAGVYEEKEEGHIRAYSVGELLKKIGWATVDYVKCDIEGAEAEVFSEPHCGEWIAGTACISVEMHDRFRPGCTEIVEAALSAADFDRCQSGEYSVFIRRQSRFGKVKDNGVESEVLQLAPTSLRPLRFRLVNVSPEPWGFMIIDENTFQLHPNNPGEPSAEMEFTIELSGQKQFSTRISVEGFGTQDVIFSVTMSEHDGIAFAEERQVGPGQMVDWIFSTFPRVGRHRVILSTRMAPGAQNHGGAWARWVAPRLR